MKCLPLGNTSLFLDVYPLHRFFMVRGFKEMEACLPQRNKLKNEVFWPIADKVEFGALHAEVSDTFQAIDEGKIAKSVEFMARHEQLNILQPAMYDNSHFALLMRGTHAGDVVSVVTGILSGAAEEIQLTLGKSMQSTRRSKSCFR